MSGSKAANPSASQSLNQQCQCASLDLSQPGELRNLLDARPHLISATPVFISPAHIAEMQHLITVIDSVVRHPAFQTRVLSWAPAIAHFVPKALGVCMGYDFHLDSAGAKLIEINTNAGGAMINSMLLRSQQQCCDNGEILTDYSKLEDVFVKMFMQEWQLQRGNTPLKRIAIVDIAPQLQYLYPEFILFAKLFESCGIQTVIADPQQLSAKHGRVWFEDQEIDLIYNRLTDFNLAAPENVLIREAYLNDQVVLTPHPHAHAIYADKRNLTILSNPDELSSLGISSEDIQTLQTGIPKTEMVTMDNNDRLWRERKNWFFKPFAGYGSKAVYRGDKLTHKVYKTIAQGGYIAQQLVTPSERLAPAGETTVSLKVDWRNYVYAGQVQLLAARLYRGQTTNFRTIGGGFAPVFQLNN